MIKKLDPYRRWLVAAVFALLLVIGLFAVQGRPLAGDERMENITLSSNIKAYYQLAGAELPASLEEIPDIAEWVDRDYGQARSYLAWPVMQLSDSAVWQQGVYHFHIYLSFLLGLFALYALVRRLTGRWTWGLVAVGLLYLNPRFFGEAFFNNKDIMLLALCLVVFWLGLRFIERVDWASCVWFGIAGAFAANSRMIGLEAWGLVGVLYLIWLTVKRKWNRRAFLRGVLAVAVFLAVFVVITPSCWADFFGYWQYYLGATSNFDAERWNNWVLYRGAVYNPVENPVPWHYIPWFMVITTPLLVLALAALWPVLTLLHCKKQPRGSRCTLELAFCVMLVVFDALPLLYAMVRRPNLYNGWRHFYFLYGTIVVLAMLSAAMLWNSRARWLRPAVGAALALNLVYYGGFIARWCPHEYAYFNFLAGAHPEERYDADYWNMGAQDAILAAMKTGGPDTRVTDIRPRPVIRGYWYTARDTWPELFGEKAEEVTWDRRWRAQYVLGNTSYWTIEQLHNDWGEDAEAMAVWTEQLRTAPVAAEIRCGRTVLWRIYENPQYKA